MNLSLKKNRRISINEGIYRRSITPYAKSHFVKSFSKTYKGARDKIMIAITGMLEHIESLLKTSKAEKIHCADHLHLVKCEFTIAGSNISAHASGNRYIILLDEKERMCTILLVYSKTDVQLSNETQRRESEIKNNYPDVTKYFTNI